MSRSRLRLLAIPALALLLLITTVLRFTVGRDLPLWIDETWTGMIVSRPTLAQLVHEMHQDANGPLYYLIGWMAAPVFGLSNDGLRIPAAIFGAATPVACLLLPDRRVGRLWCALSALWVGGLIYSQEARCYTLLWLLCTASCVVFAGLLANPTRRRAAVWVGVSSLAFLTHYYAAFLIMGQAVILVRRSGRGALALAPAALVALPAAGWLAFHLPRLAEFGAAGVAWYPKLSPGFLVFAVRELVGSDFLCVTLTFVAAALLLRRSGPRATAAPEMDCALATLLGLGVFLLIAVIRPIFSPRYLIPFVPGVLLWLAIMASRPERRLAAAPQLVVSLFAVAAATWAVSRPVPLSRNFSWEAASAWIMEARPRRLTYVWDNPAAAVLWPDSVARVAAFFVERGGRNVPVDVVTLHGREPNRLLGVTEPDAAVLWLYDVNVHGTAATRSPPKLETAARECRDFGRWWMHVYACRPVRPRIRP
jgi:hypothetical protein